MSQHALDLLPASIRARSLAGVRAGRFIMALVALAALLVVFATHSVLRRDRLREARRAAEAQADLVLRTERQAAEIQARIDEHRRLIDLYHRIALPVDLSRVLAAVVSELPEPVTLERMDLDATARRPVVSARSRGVTGPAAAGPPPPRVLRGELAGFALTDHEVAGLVDRLAQRPPFGEVSLDFSRTRVVRQTNAREFRMSFVIDLDQPYDVVSAPAAPAATAAAGAEGAPGAATVTAAPPDRAGEGG
jgi:hypothetical protein